jgi:GDPmannose 4,6-dehydratase
LSIGDFVKGCALVTGGAGQDGTYLVELLLRNDYVVHVQSRRAQPGSLHSGALHWHTGSLTDWNFLEDMIVSAEPDEIYNLASISRPVDSWKMPNETTIVNALVPQRILEIVRSRKFTCRIFQAASSEIFGNSDFALQSEKTPYNPTSPYGISKLHALLIGAAYRSNYGMHISSGIMFNHESPRRPISYVSQKIAHAAAAVAIGLSETKEKDERGYPILEDGMLRLGNLDVRRDFGFARDYVECMRMMLQMDNPDDYVIGTGESHSIREFCELAFQRAGRDWRRHVIVDQALFRKVDSHRTAADNSKAKSQLGWSPRTSFAELVNLMVEERICLLSS